MLVKNFIKAFRPATCLKQNYLAPMQRFSTENKDELPYVTDKADLHPSTLPEIPKRGSYKIMMEQGKTYFWCTCGRSENQPWCDGSHKGTDFKPYKFTWEEESRR